MGRDWIAVDLDDNAAVFASNRLHKAGMAMGFRVVDGLENLDEWEKRMRERPGKQDEPWLKFENLMKVRFKCFGGPNTNGVDGGKDGFNYFRDGPGKEARGLLQVKYYDGKVGRDDVNKTFGNMTAHGRDFFFLVSARGFTDGAYRVAESFKTKNIFGVDVPVGNLFSLKDITSGHWRRGPFGQRR